MISCRLNSVSTIEKQDAQWAGMRICRIGMIKERLHLCKLTSYLPDIRRITCGISSKNDRIHSEEVSVYTAIWYNQRTHTCANINQFIRYAWISGQRHTCWPSKIIWVRSRNCGCLVTWFCHQLIAKPGNKTAAVSWPDPYPQRIGMGIHHIGKMKGRLPTYRLTS